MAAPPDPSTFLAAGGWQPEGGPEKVAGGWDTHLWRFTTADGRQHALRVYRPGRPARAVEDEATAYAALRAAGLPVPAVEGCGAAAGHHYLVLEWMPGSTLLAALQRRPWQIWKLGLAFGRLQAQLQRLAPATVRPLGEAEWAAVIPDAPLLAALRAEVRCDASATSTTTR